jgi:hypothetical protein
VLIGEVESRLKQRINEVATELDCGVIAMEIMPEHVHLFLNCPPIPQPSLCCKVNCPLNWIDDNGCYPRATQENCALMSRFLGGTAISERLIRRPASQNARVSGEWSKAELASRSRYASRRNLPSVPIIFVH